MSQGNPISLALATRIAEALIRELAPTTVRIQVAGSIRRQCLEVRDLEIVAIPRLEERAQGQQTLLGEGGQVRVNLLHEAVDRLVQAGRIEPIKPGSKELEPDPAWAAKGEARYWRLWLPKPKVKVDLFLATPETWGAVYTLRTGPWEFSKALVSAYHQRTQGRFHKGRVHASCPPDQVPFLRTRQGYPLGPPLETPEEEDVFAACGFRWVPPEQRRGGGDLVEASQTNERSLHA